MARRFFAGVLFLFTALSAAQVDTVTAVSYAMDREMTTVVVTPEDYQDSQTEFPVVYILHGYSGGPFDWINHMDLRTLADLHQFILVCPDGDYNSWYFDSPLVKKSQYATWVGRELVRWIDDNYPTVDRQDGRAITGLSMGGHGALYLTLQNPEQYCAAATMSGVVDLTATTKKYELAEKIGSYEKNPERWNQGSLVEQVPSLAELDIGLLIDCGTEDAFIEHNRDLHQRLEAAGVEHNYIEKPGGHSWDYWTAALPEHLDYFTRYIDREPEIEPIDQRAANLMCLMEQAISDSAWPGGVLLARSKGETIVFDATGYHTYDRKISTRRDDIFDLASITKVISTTSAAAKLHENGLLVLDAKVVQYIPEFRGKKFFRDRAKKQVTVKHLLTHTTGLPPFKQYYRIDGSIEDRVAEIFATSLDRKPGLKTVYSDIGIITMGKIVEQLTGMGLDEYVDQEVFTPLGMAATGYTPCKRKLYRIVPTEIDPDGKLVHGYVHDENANSLGGVAGHAGLFSTAEDLARFARMMLNEGELDDIRIFQPETVELFTKRANVIEGSSRCLGWDSPSDNASGGVYISDNAFGHTGFTGTSLWIDPDNDIVVVLLTNAVHPNRSWKSPNYFDWRQRIHSAVYEELGFDVQNPNLTWRQRWQSAESTDDSTQ